MRRLLRFEMEGFKTFRNKTDVVMDHGMTAIVGPNGSGKSNLIDAIAWAVGSRSWKTLRGEGMEDVISHGADRQPGAPFARVTLAFDNEDKLLGLGFSEVEITRELIRGGGSRILVNGVETRLRDVQSILAGTGLVGGFSLIRQGAVDKLILSPPEDLRRWMEESANIAAYRTRKQEAVDRLKKVEALLGDAERRSAALQRELANVRSRAERARERRILEERRFLLLESLRALELQRLEKAMEVFRGDIAGLETRERELAEGRAAAEASRQAQLGALEQLGIEEAQRASTPEPESLRAEEILEKSLRIRQVSGTLDRAAVELERQGPAAWPQVAAVLAKAERDLQEVRRPGIRSRAPLELSSAVSAHLADLREKSSQVERFDRESAQVGAELAARRCDLARLEERRAAAGQALRIPDAPELTDAQAVQARIDVETMSREIDRIGPVDETAEGREDELRRECESLQPALQDLGSSRSQLQEFIRQMEEITARIFSHTLEQVGARFRKYFGILFEGGDARLEQIPAARGGEGEGAFPTGVEVRIRLPRKPETSLSLLSGGERSLAGLALILALASGDTPEGRETGRLIILDEVDAALDETNAARLALLLHELERTHQILCVSHNRLTMHQASQLIGVTSKSAAVSGLVKVRLEGRPALAAATRAGTPGEPMREKMLAPAAS